MDSTPAYRDKLWKRYGNRELEIITNLRGLNFSFAKYGEANLYQEMSGTERNGGKLEERRRRNGLVAFNHR